MITAIFTTVWISMPSCGVFPATPEETIPYADFTVTLDKIVIRNANGRKFLYECMGLDASGKTAEAGKFK